MHVLYARSTQTFSLTPLCLCVYACLCVCAGETEEQYLATEALVRQIGFDRVNTAAYSPRPNTPAAEWDNQVRHNREQGGWIDGPACGCGGCVWGGRGCIWGLRAQEEK